MNDKSTPTNGLPWLGASSDDDQSTRSLDVHREVRSRLEQRDPDESTSDQMQSAWPGLVSEQRGRDSTSDQDLGGDEHELSSEGLSGEDHRKLRSETKGEGHSYEWPRGEGLSPEPFAVQNCSSTTPSRLSALASVGLGEQASALVAAMPPSREGKSAWLKQLACEEAIAIHLVRLFGGDPRGLDLPFACLLHQDCMVSLTRGGNGQIVYHDPALASCKREFQTIPELAVSLRIGRPCRLRGLQLALWSIRLLYEAGLIQLAPVPVPAVATDSPEPVQRARNGFQLLVRCRWLLDPGEPVAYTRSFVEPWCAISPGESRAVIYALIQQGVIRKAGEARSNFKHATSLYLPGQGEPA